MQIKLIKFIIYFIIKIISLFNFLKIKLSIVLNGMLINSYTSNGFKPWSQGYIEYKNQKIIEYINNEEIINLFKYSKTLPTNYGSYIDERIVEYPWLISRLNEKSSNILDAGSALNFEYIINHNLIKTKNLTILTLYPEENCFYQKGISYHYGDLRHLPFADNFFCEIVSISTLEHVGMDNSMYANRIITSEKRYTDYLLAVKEIHRVLAKGGRLLLTVPYGKFLDYGYFFQFDRDKIDKLIELFNPAHLEISYYAYINSNWKLSNDEESRNLEAFNIHESMYFNKSSKKGYDDDLAPSCRSVICLELIKG